MSKIEQTVKKVYELALRGVDGEKEAAMRKFRDLCEKYDLNPEDFESKKVEKHFLYLTYKNQQFFKQVIASELGRDFTMYYVDGHRYHRYLECTASQFAIIVAKFEFYWDDYQKQLEQFYEAYVHKNELTMSSDPNEEPEPMTPEERQRMWEIMQKMSGIDKVTMRKRIES